MRGVAAVSRRELLPGEAGELRRITRREVGERLVADGFGLDLVDVDDVRRPWRRLADLERPDCRLDVPRVVVPSRDPGPAEPDRARARQPAQLGRMARAEDEVLESLGPGDERVLHLVRPVDDAVERAHLVHLAVLPGEPRAGENEVELLGRAVRVWRRRQLARLDADTVHPNGARTRGGAEPLPRRVHFTFGRAEGLDLVPVSDGHRAQSVRIADLSPRRARRPCRRPSGRRRIRRRSPRWTRSGAARGPGR